MFDRRNYRRALKAAELLRELCPGIEFTLCGGGYHADAQWVAEVAGEPKAFEAWVEEDHRRARKGEPDLPWISPAECLGRRRKLSDRAARMLSILRDLAGGEDRCSPSNGDLANLAGFKSIESVQSTLEKLEALGWIERLYGGTEGGKYRPRIIRLIRPLDADEPVGPRLAGNAA